MALAPAEIAFVGIVIITAPLAGLALMWRRPVTGAAVVAAALGASLLFGLVEHFMLGGADHVSHVAAPWRPLFGTTAILVAVLEAAGTVAAVVSLAQSQVRRVA